MRYRNALALCAAIMAALAGIAYVKSGLSIVTFFLAFLLLGCLFSMVAAWWIARQSLRALDEHAPQARRPAKPEIGLWTHVRN